jgi:hypothetical protein
MEAANRAVEDIPLPIRFFLFWATLAAFVGLLYVISHERLLPGTGVPSERYFADFQIGWSALIFGLASIGWLNGLIRRALEDALLDADAGSPEEAAARRKDRFFRRVVANNHHWFWTTKARVQRMTGAEFLIMERRRRIQFWLTTLGFWLLTVGASRPEIAGYERLPVLIGFALAFGFPFFKGIEGLGKRG